MFLIVLTYCAYIINTVIPKHLLNTGPWCPSSQHRPIWVLPWLPLLFVGFRSADGYSQTGCAWKRAASELEPLKPNTEVEVKTSLSSWVFPLSLALSLQTGHIYPLESPALSHFSISNWKMILNNTLKDKDSRTPLHGPVPCLLTPRLSRTRFFHKYHRLSTYCVPGMVTEVLYVLSYLIPQQPYEEDVVFILQIRKLRKNSVKWFHKFTQLARGKAGTSPQAKARLCLYLLCFVVFLIILFLFIRQAFRVPTMYPALSQRSARQRDMPSGCSQPNATNAVVKMCIQCLGIPRRKL